MDRTKLGSRIDAAIRDAKAKRQHLADALGVHPDTLRKWCRGATSPTADELGRLCELLDVSADQVLGLRPRIPANVHILDVPKVKRILSTTNAKELEGLMLWHVPPSDVAFHLEEGMEAVSAEQVQATFSRIGAHFAEHSPRAWRRWLKTYPDRQIS
jgi:transcriptional regulator with XRE-family HTH domain